MIGNLILTVTYLNTKMTLKVKPTVYKRKSIFTPASHIETEINESILFQNMQNYKVFNNIHVYIIKLYFTYIPKIPTQA